MEDIADIRVAHLAEHQDAIPVLAGWSFDEWGHLTPGLTIQDLIDKFSEHAVPGRIPETLVALDGERVVGTISIVETDLTTRPELTPWVGELFIDPDYRSRGIGSLLLRALMDEAVTLGVKRLHLFTPDQMDYYARRGWTALERINYRGEDVTLMIWDTEQ